MADKLKGYIILESPTVTDEPKIVEKSGTTVTIEANLQDADNKNRNKRLYSFGVLDEGIKRDYIKERLKTKSLYGEAGHPLNPDLQRQVYIDQTRISHIVTGLNWEAKVLKGRVESANTVVGKDFKGLIEQGSQVAFSMRGVGPITESRGDYVEVKSPLNILTWDWVIHPSHSVAYMQRVVTESTLGMLLPKEADVRCAMISEGLVFPLQASESEVKEVLTATSRNFRAIMEQFEVDLRAASAVTLAEDARYVDVKAPGQTVRVLVEDYASATLDDLLLKGIKEQWRG